MHRCVMQTPCKEMNIGELYGALQIVIVDRTFEVQCRPGRLVAESRTVTVGIRECNE